METAKLSRAQQLAILIKTKGKLPSGQVQPQTPSSSKSLFEANSQLF